MAQQRSSNAHSERDGDLELNVSDPGNNSSPHENHREELEVAPVTGSIIKGHTSKSQTHDMSAGIVIPVPENINVNETNDQRISFRRYPCTLWCAGAFIIGCAWYLIYHLALGHHGTLFKGYREG